MKHNHEVRDSIHSFISFDSADRTVIDSRPVQRLRYIHQLAFSYLLYPGAHHTRFEHSLGVMELAGRVFDEIFINKQNLMSAEVRDCLGNLTPERLGYWKKTLRMAALCHDLGHLPFSHAAEKEVLETGWTHETISKQLILSDEMKGIWERMEPSLNPEIISKLALGPKEYHGVAFSAMEALLAEIITGDSFGVDRIDYLLRDSHHLGVPFGKVDLHRLIGCLRILISPPLDDKELGSPVPTLGIEDGGIQAAEGLLLARYFMFSQVYFHPVRKIYDVHFEDFMKVQFSGKKIKVDHSGDGVQDFLELTDDKILGLMRDEIKSGGDNSTNADRIINRKHFKLFYKTGFSNKGKLKAVEVYENACKEFGQENVKYKKCSKDSGANFAAEETGKKTVWATQISETICRIPPISFEYVYIDPSLRDKAVKWMAAKGGEHGRAN